MREGSLDPQAVDAAARDAKLGAQFQRFLGCGEAFERMVEAAGATPAGRAAAQAQDPRALYTQYLHCVGGAVCEQALQGWYACLRGAPDKRKAFADCKRTRRMLERCLRAKTEDLLRASQPDVFRPST